MEMQFIRKVSYLGDNAGILKMMRESLEEPAEITYLILIYSDRKNRDKYVKTPFNYRKQSIRFSKYEHIIVYMRNLSEVMRDKMKTGLPDLYMDWLRTEPAGNAVWAVHFWEAKNGDLNGRAYYVPEDRESVFYGTGNLLKIFYSVKEDDDGRNRRASETP